MLVTEVEHLSYETFRRQHLERGVPVLVRGGAASWPACGWTWERLTGLGGDIAVRCEVGDTMQGANTHLDTSLADYIGGVASNSVGAATYLTQFELFDALPQLRSDVDFSLLRDRRIRRMLAWIGPAGTRTGIHADHADNLLAQIRGRKWFRTARPDERSRLHPSRKYDFFSDCSSVVPDRWDPETQPGFDLVDWAEFVLEPGDLLFNPSGWWHEAVALEPSISVNVFGVSVLGLASRWRLLGKEALHRAGLYRRGWCTCHGRSPADLTA
jgi:ribosomal protein L16 Arg81 hydroxylase